MFSSRRRSAVASGLLHASAIVLILVTTRVEEKKPAPVLRYTPLEPRSFESYRQAMSSRPGRDSGGGQRDDTRASKGRLPRFAPRQFTPPTAVIRNFDPLLAMEPTLVGNLQLKTPDVTLPFGDPNGVAGPPSGGRGSGGGIGDGKGTGVGDLAGPGYGQGDGDGPGGLRAHILGTITAPVLLVKTEPEYSDEARRAKVQGMVILYIEVNVQGRAQNIQVKHSLGLGLDEKAVEAVKKWKFRPGMQNGKPVVTTATVEVNFRLL